MTMINVALDLHGTYDASPDQFEQLFLAKNNCARFWIFSSSPTEHISEYIRHRSENTADQQLINFLSTELKCISIVDYCISQQFPLVVKSAETIGDKQFKYFSGDAEIWWAMKAIICKKYKIDLIFDDRIEYHQYFGGTHPTQYFHFENLHSSVEIVQTVIDAHQCRSF